MDFKNIFETGLPHLKKLVIIALYNLVVFMQHDPGELRGLKSWTLAKIQLSRYYMFAI